MLGWLDYRRFLYENRTLAWASRPEEGISLDPRCFFRGDIRRRDDGGLGIEV